MVAACRGGLCVGGCRVVFFFSSRRRHTRFKCDWSSDVCSSDLLMKHGELVPDSLVLKMVAHRIEQPDCAHGFVFDGFPRTVAQAQYLTILLRQNGYKLALGVHFVIDPQLLLRRIAGARLGEARRETVSNYARP